MVKNLLLLLFSCLSVSVSFAQIIEIEPAIDPPFFEANEEITISYDVTGTIMHDWQEAWLLNKQRLSPIKRQPLSFSL